MGERVFEWTCGMGDRWQVRFNSPDEVVYATQVSGPGAGFRSVHTYDLDNATRHFTEVFSPPAVEVLPEPQSELTALRDFYEAIKTSFADPCKRNHQLDIQAAFDRVQVVLKQEQTNV